MRHLKLVACFPDLDAVKSEEEEAPQAGEWWSQFVEPEHFEDLRISSKLVLLFAILKESEQIGDKVYVIYADIIKFYNVS